MNYHNITTDDMLNGSGLRTCLWCSGCSHYCYKCQNPQTWGVNSGIPFDEKAEKELFEKLSKDYISGITFTGGDPLNTNNLSEVLRLCKKFRILFGNSKNIWIYTGYTWDDILHESTTSDSKLEHDMRKQIIELSDVLVDGKFNEDFLSVEYPWAGSTNQRIIDIQKSLSSNNIVEWKCE